MENKLSVVRQISKISTDNIYNSIKEKTDTSQHSTFAIRSSLPQAKNCKRAVLPHPKRKTCLPYFSLVRKTEKIKGKSPLMNDRRKGLKLLTKYKKYRADGVKRHLFAIFELQSCGTKTML